MNRYLKNLPEDQIVRTAGLAALGLLGAAVPTSFYLLDGAPPLKCLYIAVVGVLLVTALGLLLVGVGREVLRMLRFVTVAYRRMQRRTRADAPTTVEPALAA